MIIKVAFKWNFDDHRVLQIAATRFFVRAAGRFSYLLEIT